MNSDIHESRPGVENEWIIKFKKRFVFIRVYSWLKFLFLNALSLFNPRQNSIDRFAEHFGARQ
jgi:hypothetical protein